MLVGADCGDTPICIVTLPKGPYPLDCSIPEQMIAGQQLWPADQSVVKYQTCLM